MNERKPTDCFNAFGITREQYEDDLADDGVTLGYKAWLKGACGDPYGVYPNRGGGDWLGWLVFAIALAAALHVVGSVVLAWLGSPA